jgi:tetratricopeptide (TPR) repeat protein
LIAFASAQARFCRIVHRGWIGKMANTEGELARLTARTMRADEMLQASRRLMANADGSHWSLAASYHGKALYAQGRIADALAMFEQAWERADQIDDPDAAALAAIHGGACCMTLYDYAQAEEWSMREHELPRSPAATLRPSLTDLLAGARASQGNLAGARNALAEFEGAASKHSVLAYCEGDWERAVLLLRKDLDAARAAGQPIEVGDWASVLGRIARAGNQRAEAEAYLNEALTASLACPDLNRELFTRIELAGLSADFGRIAAAKEHLERSQQILDNGEDWRGHRGAFAYASALVSAAEHIRRAKSSDELWKASVETGLALRLPEKVSDGFRAAIEIFHRYHAPWEEAASLLFWARAMFAASHHRKAVETSNRAFAILDRIATPRFCDRLQTEIFRFLSIDSRATSMTMGDLRGSNIFRKEGDYWTISFAGLVLRLRDTMGMHYISRLIANPGMKFSAQDLAASARKTKLKRGGQRKTQSSRSDDRSHGDRVDQNDVARERARQMVTKRIKDATAKIRQTHPDLARHFATRIRTGYTCTYVEDRDHSGAWVT